MPTNVNKERFGSVIDKIIDAEQGYVNHPSDKGGPTKYGITEAVARANGYYGSMIDMPRYVAENIYLSRYIEVPRFDELYAIAPSVATEVIDTGVNMGPSRAAEFLQRWMNAFNKNGSGYGDLFVDGRLGPLTFDALKRYVAFRNDAGVKVLVNALNCSQGARYLAITEADKSQRDFVYGWMANRVTLS